MLEVEKVKRSIEFIRKKMFCANCNYELVDRVNDASRMLLEKPLRKSSLYNPAYEKRWRELASHKQVFVHYFYMSAIGESSARLCKAILAINGDENYHVFIPCFEKSQSKLFNNRYIEVFNNTLNILDKSNIDFWKYIFIKHGKEINCTELHKYNSKNGTYINVALGNGMVPFSKRQVDEAEGKIKSIGIDKEYVCAYARGLESKKNAFQKEIIDESYLGGVQFSTYSKALSYISSLGLSAIKLGKFDSKEQYENVINYSTNYQDDLLDLYFLCKCNFMLASGGGIAFSAGYFGCPVLFTNLLGLSDGYDSVPVTGYELFLPKKIFSKSKNRYLNFYEMYVCSGESMALASYYKKNNLIVVDNDEDEILDAVKEMKMKLDGTWIETADERKTMAMYWEIVDKWKCNAEIPLRARRLLRSTKFVPCPWKPSYTFLKRNIYLLREAA